MRSASQYSEGMQRSCSPSSRRKLRASLSRREGGGMERINVAEKFARFSEQWQPKIVAELNGQEVKLVKVQGTFPWHHHDDVEEMFPVWQGRFRVEFRNRIVELGPGELV